jgi:hypothetical protein
MVATVVSMKDDWATVFDTQGGRARRGAGPASRGR